jgi:hypothetical protein
MLLVKRPTERLLTEQRTTPDFTERFSDVSQMTTKLHLISLEKTVSGTTT